MSEIGSTPGSAARTASIKIDPTWPTPEVPNSSHGSDTVHRAKAYIGALLRDATLDAPQRAAAMGRLLRRLRELFNERGRYIPDSIWERRLEAAAKRRGD